jgi:hypothetical protein
MEARGSFSLNPVSHFEQIAYFLHGGIAILKHCAIRRSSTGLPLWPKLPILNTTVALTPWKTNTVSPTIVRSTNTFFRTKPIRFAGSRSGQPIATVRRSNFALRRDERTKLFLKPTPQAT